MQIIKTLIRIVSEFGVLGWSEIIATLLVAVGCLGELWIILNKLTRHVEHLAKNAGIVWRILAWGDSIVRPIVLRLKIRGRKLPEAKEQLLERFFVMLIALGVAGELICLMFSLHEVATLNKEAEQTRKDAGEASERAAILTDRANSNELVTAKLLKAINPRSFTDPDMSAKHLTNFAGAKFCIIENAEGDEFDARWTAKKIRFVLKKAGWIEKPVGGRIMSVGKRWEFPPDPKDENVSPFEGIMVGAAPRPGDDDEWTKKAPAAAGALTKELRSNEIAAIMVGPPLERLEQMIPGIVYVQICRRPLPAGENGFK